MPSLHFEKKKGSGYRVQISVSVLGNWWFSSERKCVCVCVSVRCGKAFGIGLQHILCVHYGLLAPSATYRALGHHKLACMNTSFFSLYPKVPSNLLAFASLTQVIGNLISFRARQRYKIHMHSHTALLQQATVSKTVWPCYCGSIEKFRLYCSWT